MNEGRHLTVVERPKPPSMSAQLAELSRLMVIVEEYFERGEDVPDDLLPMFDMTRGALAETVDRRVGFLESIDLLIAKRKDDKTFIDGHIKILEHLRKRVRQHTKAVVEIYEAKGFELMGTMKGLTVRPNGGSKPVTWGIEFLDVKNVLRPWDVTRIPDAFVEKVEVYVFKKDAFERALRDGTVSVPPDVARLEDRGTHLRII